VWQRWGRFDPSRASAKTFAARLVEHKAHCCLNARFPSQCLVEIWSEAERVASAQAFTLRVEMRADVWHSLAQLPDPLRVVALALMMYSVKEAATKIGISRPTMYRRISKIRKQFTGSGLDGYMPNANLSYNRCQPSVQEDI
jgi:DNA-directed RNA polymerase specialized sigma24 family protein